MLRVSGPVAPPPHDAGSRTVPESGVAVLSGPPSSASAASAAARTTAPASRGPMRVAALPATDTGGRAVTHSSSR